MITVGEIFSFSSNVFGPVKLACLLIQEKSNLVDSAEWSLVNLNNKYEENQPEAHTTNYDLEVQNEVLGVGCHDICMLNVTAERNAKALEVKVFKTSFDI